jgi:hypothetical protein
MTSADQRALDLVRTGAVTWTCRQGDYGSWNNAAGLSQALGRLMRAGAIKIVGAPAKGAVLRVEAA